MTRLVVVGGPAGTAKLACAWSIAAEDPDLRFLHRDQVRVLFGRLLDEADLTRLLGDMAWSLLSRGYGVVTAGQNLAPSDRAQWERVAAETGATLEWISTEEGSHVSGFFAGLNPEQKEKALAYRGEEKHGAKAMLAERAKGDGA